MAAFEEAVNLVLKHEGGYVNNPADPGGETNFGISKRAYPSLDIANLTQDDAKAIYQKDYWRPYMEQEPNQVVANCALDCAVNQGPGAAHDLYLHFGHSLKEFQLARLLRYINLVAKRPQDIASAHSWVERVLDV